VKGKTQLLPDAGPELVVHVGAAVVVVVVTVVVVVEEVVVVVVVVVVEQTLVVQTFTPEELQTQVLQSTVLRAPGVQELGGAAVVVVVVVVVPEVDTVWHEEVELVSQSPQELVTTLLLESTERAHQGRVESAKVQAE